MGSDTLSPRVRRWYDRFVPFRVRHSQRDPDGSTEAGPPGAAGGHESGFSSLSGADGPAALSAEDLQPGRTATFRVSIACRTVLKLEPTRSRTERAV